MIDISMNQIADFVGVAPLGLPMQATVNYDEGNRVPMRVHRVTNDPILFVHFNGAVNRDSRPDGVVFQRSTWADAMRGVCVYLADPSIIQHKQMWLGWGQTDLEAEYFPSVAAQIARILSGVLGVPKRIYVGSSAGGFQAAAASLYDGDSPAWVNNAQFDWTKYESVDAVEKVVKRIGLRSAEELRIRAPWRTSIPKLAEHLSREAQVHYLINTDSPFDCQRQLPVFKEIVGDTSLEEYKDEQSGHNPLGKDKWIERLLAFGGFE